jgi:3'(2'), 5'-bisphosphate nucleotidase
MENDIEPVKKIVAEAGKLILEYFHRQKALGEVLHKEDHSPLTQADLSANKYIVEQLQRLDPDIPIVSEEARIPEYETRKTWTHFWLVDPLDGTKEFLKGRDEFTVNVALIDSHEPVLGVVGIPAKNLLYYAVKGQGAFKQEGDLLPQRIFSAIPKVSQGLTVVESASHPSQELESYLKTLPVKKRIHAGSSLKFCLVAEGQADIYPRLNPTMEWDVAAGDCIFRNSARTGQRISSLTYNKETLKNSRFVIGLDG